MNFGFDSRFVQSLAEGDGVPRLLPTLVKEADYGIAGCCARATATRRAAEQRDELPVSS